MVDFKSNEMPWSKLKRSMESRLAGSLEGRVQIHVTRYRRGGDDEIGRMWMTLGKQQIFSSGDALSETKEQWYLKDDCVYFNRMNDNHLSEEALLTSLDASIEDILTSSHPLVRALAMFDKRVGKRRLQALSTTIENEPLIVRHFYALRCHAEGMRLEDAMNCQTPSQ